MAEGSLRLETICVECAGGVFSHYPGDVLRCVACGSERQKFVMRGKSRYPCPTKDCPGDGRYAPPGRGHLDTCTAWLSVDESGVTPRNSGEHEICPDCRGNDPDACTRCIVEARCYCEPGMTCDYHL